MTVGKCRSVLLFVALPTACREMMRKTGGAPPRRLPALRTIYFGLTVVSAGLEVERSW